MNSIWMNDYINRYLPSVTKDMSTPVLIIGGGIAGLMCAYNLMKNNTKFILVDRQKLAAGVSAKTTAQVSIAHDKLYSEIKKKFDVETAISYLKSQMEGLKIIKDIIKKEKIKCDYKEESTILHADKKKNVKIIDEQYKIIKDYNINCELLNFKKGDICFFKGIEFKNQFIFNPMKYMMGIIEILIKKKTELYENSLVTRIEKKENNYEVEINDKYKIITDKIIMACHYPILNPDNLYFAKIYQSKSYAIAFKTKHKLDANYVSLDKPYYYFRTYDNSTLIIGGCDHFTGINNSINKCYKALENKIYEIDKNAKIICKWFNEDAMTIDSLPFVGEYSYRNPNILLISGFNKWGFTNSHIAAQIITDKLLDKECDKLYHTKRFTLIKAFVGTLRMVAHVVDGLVLSKLTVKDCELNDIKIGSGKITRYKNMNVLVYRESIDKYIFLENKCTHMGCSLIWNDVDKLWESKCHGSIFDRYGKVIYGPAIKDLKRLYIH